MGADATLVNMAYHASMANTPGDWSKSFNTQYEGLIKAYEAQSEGLKDIMTKVTTNIGDITTAIDTKQKEAWKFIDEMDIPAAASSLATDNTINTAKEYAGHYAQGGGSNIGNTYSSEDYLTAIRDGEVPPDFQGDATEFGKGLAYYADKSFLSKEDRREQSRLRKLATQHKSDLIQSKGALKTIVEASNEDLIDWDHSFENDPEKQNLLAQVIHPKLDWDAAKVKSFWKNNEKFYKYQSGTLKSSYIANKGDMDVSAAVTGDTTPFADSKPWAIISEKELFGGVQYKDTDSVTTLGGGFDSAVANATTLFEGADGVIRYNIEDFSKIENSVTSANKEILMTSKNFSYLATSDIDVGNTKRNYSDDLKENLEIDKAVMDQIGIGSDIIKLADINSDGFINEDDSDDLKAAELKEHNDAKAIIIGKLTNPQTRQEKEIAANELAEYWTGFTKQAFDDARTRNGEIKQPVKELTARQIAAGKKAKELELNKNYGLDLKNSYFTNYVTDVNGKRSPIFVDGQMIKDTADTFFNIEEKGEGSFAGYDGNQHTYKNYKWTSTGPGGVPYESNRNTIINGLRWSTIPGVVAFLGPARVAPKEIEKTAKEIKEETKQAKKFEANKKLRKEALEWVSIKRKNPRIYVPSLQKYFETKERNNDEAIEENYQKAREAIIAQYPIE